MFVQNHEDDSERYNCELCIAKELVNNHRGRLCMLHIDLDNDVLEYSSATKEKSISGQITSVEEFQQAVNGLLEFFKSTRLEPALKRISLKGSRISGVCVKSFPRTWLTTHILGKLLICLGGQSGSELIHMPFGGSLFEQPNIFIEAYRIYTEEYSADFKRRFKKDNNSSNDSPRQNRRDIRSDIS